MSRAQVLLLTQKAEVKQVTLPLQGAPGAPGTISLKSLQTLLKKKEEPELIGTYKAKPHTLFLFGYLKGRAGTENKHELPPPHDSILAFGDIVLIASKDSKSWATPVPFKAEDYETFYTKAFGGFEELDEDEEDEEELEEEPEAEADVEVVEGEEDEEAEEDVADEDDEEDEEEDVEAEEDVVEDEDAPVIPRVAPKAKAAAKAKKARRGATGTAAVAMTNSGQIPYLHVPLEDELKPEAARTGCAMREKVAVALSSLFASLLTAEQIGELEQCIYHATLRSAAQRHVGKAWAHEPFVELYKMVAKQIASNFHPSSYVGNTELFDRWKAGHITFNEISQMDPYQLFHGRWEASFEAQMLREKRQEEGNKAMATDQFVCTRCWKRECTYYEMQTRSADEPMTIFITCLNCGKHWRQ